VINEGTKMATIKTIDTIRCPNCGSTNYLSYKELYDEEWISLKCECLSCKSLFQINYRAVNIDKLRNKKPEL